MSSRRSRWLALLTSSLVFLFHLQPVWTARVPNVPCCSIISYTDHSFIFPAWQITTSQDTALFRSFSTFTTLKHSDSDFGVYLSLSNYKAISPSSLGIEAFFWKAQETQEVNKMSHSWNLQDSLKSLLRETLSRKIKQNKNPSPDLQKETDQVRKGKLYRGPQGHSLASLSLLLRQASQWDSCAWVIPAPVSDPSPIHLLETPKKLTGSPSDHWRSSDFSLSGAPSLK